MVAEGSPLKLLNCVISIVTDCVISLHAACCAPVARTGAVVARLQRPFAALAALLFAVHPIHTEAVSY